MLWQRRQNSPSMAASRITPTQGRAVAAAQSSTSASPGQFPPSHRPLADIRITLTGSERSAQNRAGPPSPLRRRSRTDAGHAGASALMTGARAGPPPPGRLPTRKSLPVPAQTSTRFSNVSGRACNHAANAGRGLSMPLSTPPWQSRAGTQRHRAVRGCGDDVTARDRFAHRIRTENCPDRILRCEPRFVRRPTGHQATSCV